MQYVTIWVSEVGEIKLPPDFPHHIIRKDGQWDKRFKTERLKWQAFIAAETAKLWTA
jgi:hypothetical protein